MFFGIAMALAGCTRDGRVDGRDEHFCAIGLLNFGDGAWVINMIELLGHTNEDGGDREERDGSAKEDHPRYCTGEFIQCAGHTAGENHE